MKNKKLTQFRSLRWLMIILCAVSFLSNSVQAQTGVAPVLTPVLGFGVDGDAVANYPSPGMYSTAGDWFANPPYCGPCSIFNMSTPDPFDVNFPLTIHYNDPWEGVDPTIFTQSSKIYDPYDETFKWGDGYVPNKNEINNATAHFTWGNPALGGDTTDLWCVFAADRMVNNGDAYIDFEFLQSPVMMVYNADSTGGYFEGYGPDGTRTVGDLIVTIQFVNGGTNAIVVIHRWESDGAGGFNYYEQPLSNYVGDIYVTSNTALTIAPWNPYGQTSYDYNQYAEGAINLSEVMGFAAGGCGYLSTVFVRTKTSQSTSAVLKDFPGAPYQANISLNDLEVFCPDDVFLPQCSVSADITEAYNDWKDGFTHQGGHGIIHTNILDIPTLPTNIACGDTIYFTYSIYDTCNDVPLTCSSAFGVAADKTKPIIVDGQDVVLTGCNPAWPTVVQTTWSDNCGGSGTISGVAGSIVTNGCTQYIDYTFNVSDACGNAALPVVMRVSRHYDVTKPIIVDGQDVVLTGCNPAWPTVVQTTWSDNCGGSGTISGVAGSVITNGCTQYIDYTFNVSDDCGNAALPVVMRVSRHYDVTKPIIVDGQDVVLTGCNPNWPTVVETTWSDNCGGSGNIAGVPG
ncbi:MAG: hypothetical protein WCQ70_06415, partial [Lentimicrobiaceae bacterium]